MNCLQSDDFEMYEVKKNCTACRIALTIRTNIEWAESMRWCHHLNLQELIDQGRLKLTEGGAFEGKKIIISDSCYMVRA